MPRLVTALMGIGLLVSVAPSLPAAASARVCAGRAATIEGTSGDDQLRGTGRDDVIFAGAGRDSVDGRGGNDIVCGGHGDDSLSGGGGNDRLLGGPGSDFVQGQEGNDRIVTGKGRSHILMGGPGDDSFSGGPGIGDVVDFGTAPAGVIVDLASGTAVGEGNDTLAAVDVVFGSPFADSLTGNDRPNALAGRDGNDIIVSGGGGVLSGPSPFIGAFGKGDVLLGEGGDDSLIGGDGFDVVMYFDAPAAVTVNLETGTATGDGADSLENIEGVHSSRNGDTLIGNDRDNAFGLSANGHDVDGGGGTDLIFIVYALDDRGRPIGVDVDLAAGTATGQGISTLTSIENVWGTPGPDTISGDDGANVLRGREGNDRLHGAGGDDVLDGGSGKDEGDGGAGTDTCRTVENESRCEA